MKDNIESLQIPVTWDSAARKRDKSVSLRFTSAFEVTNEDFATMDRMMGNAGWLLFRPNESFRDSDIPEDDAPEGGKTKLQRLRSVYFIYWKEHTDQSEPFKVYWDRRFEKLIDGIKEKLD